jgi:hypothetical protein
MPTQTPRRREPPALLLRTGSMYPSGDPIRDVNVNCATESIVQRKVAARGLLPHAAVQESPTNERMINLHRLAGRKLYGMLGYARIDGAVQFLSGLNAAGWPEPATYPLTKQWQLASLLYIVLLKTGRSYWYGSINCRACCAWTPRYGLQAFRESTGGSLVGSKYDTKERRIHAYVCSFIVLIVRLISVAPFIPPLGSSNAIRFARKRCCTRDTPTLSLKRVSSWASGILPRRSRSSSVISLTGLLSDNAT